MRRIAEVTGTILPGLLLFSAGPAVARNATLEISSTSDQAGANVAAAVQGAADSAGGQGALVPARITVSRASDHVGKPVYFSRSRAAGSAGVVSISSRSLPSGAIFSVALRPVPAPIYGASALPSPGSMPSALPVAARAITSGFGLRQHPLLGTWRAHSGLDLAAPYGSPIVATSDGVVSTAAWQGGYGLLVTLDHGGGVQTRYGHMSRLNVVAGQQIRKGGVIGYVGSTGMSTGPHLHYEIRMNGRAINPAPHLHER